MTFSKRLQLLRIDKEMLQKELAENLNLSTSSISAYENEIAFPSLSGLISIAEYFNTSTDYLLGITDVNSGFPNDPNPKRLIINLPQNATQELRKSIENNAYSTINLFKILTKS